MHLEGRTIEDRVLVGSGSVVMHEVVARSESVVGAGAVVPNGIELPAGAMALGVPARVKPDAVRRDFTTTTSALYVDNARRYALELAAVVMPPRGIGHEGRVVRLLAARSGTVRRMASPGAGGFLPLRSRRADG